MPKSATGAEMHAAVHTDAHALAATINPAVCCRVLARRSGSPSAARIAFPPVAPSTALAKGACSSPREATPPTNTRARRPPSARALHRIGTALSQEYHRPAASFSRLGLDPTTCALGFGDRALVSLAAVEEKRRDREGQPLLTVMGPLRTTSPLGSEAASGGCQPREMPLVKPPFRQGERSGLMQLAVMQAEHAVSRTS